MLEIRIDRRLFYLMVGLGILTVLILGAVEVLVFTSLL